MTGIRGIVGVVRIRVVTVTKPTGNLRKISTSSKLSKTSTGDTPTNQAHYQMMITNGLLEVRLLRGDSVTALILGFDDSTLSQRLLINVLLKSCISVLFIILVELVSMWLGSLCKDSPRFY